MTGMGKRNMEYYLIVDDRPVCSSRLVQAAELASDAIGGGFTRRCGHRTEVDALLAAVRLRRLLGQGPSIQICPGSCPISAAETACDNARLN